MVTMKDQRMEPRQAKWTRLPLVCAAVVAALAGLMLAASPAAASNTGPNVYAMFVGIADYQYGTEDGAFSDLEGAPVDIAAMKGALETRMDLQRSVTLLDQQATRRAILDTFNSLAGEAAPGDILLFYYSGHGGRVFDMTGQQVSGFSSTLVPYDARNPALPAREAGDILDNELRIIIEAARANGVNVVTIFDSCNSGTATRDPNFGQADVRKRGAPELLVETPIEPDVVPLTAAVTRSASPAAPGYTVHIAAAPDGESALERKIGGQWRGDFTDAFVDALEELPSTATYRDLLLAVQINLRQWLRGSGEARVMLDVRGEGALDQSFLGGWNPARLLEGTRGEDGVWRLDAGSIAGVTVGSRYSGFASGGDALAEGAMPIATAYVDATLPSSSSLVLDAGVQADTLPDTITWRETSRGAGDNPLRVALYPDETAATSNTINTLGGLDFVELTQEAADLVLYLDEPGTVRVARVEDASTITSIPSADGARLGEVLGQISRYRNLLDLIGAGTKLNVEFDISDVDCLWGNPLPEIQTSNGEPQFVSGDPERNRFWLKITNNEDRPLYPYLINLTANFGIAFANGTPAPNATSEALPSEVCWNWPATVSGEGRDYMILVMSERPLPGLRNLGQPELLARSATDPLTNIIERAADGLRSASAPVPEGAWSVQAVTYTIEGAKK